MDSVRIIEVKRSIFDDNDKDAEKLRTELKNKGVFLLNLMSSPGSGKTTTLIKTINLLKIINYILLIVRLVKMMVILNLFLYPILVVLQIN